MNILLIGSFPTSLPLFTELLNSQSIYGVMLFKDSYSKDRRNDLSQMFKETGVDYGWVSKKDFNDRLSAYILENPIDLVIVCGCSMKIRTSLLELPDKGFINIHFGKLPENRGANPVYWTVRNNDQNTAVSIHKMNQSFDHGPIIAQDEMQIRLGETAGIVNSRLSILAVQTLKTALSRLDNPETFVKQDQPELYNHKPRLDDTSINWETQKANEIEALVNACNPNFGGATTYYQGGELKIIEVSPVDHTPMITEKPGAIVHAHPTEGLYVCCRYGELIKINILSTDAGILSGKKYVSMGIRTGQVFTTKKNQVTKLYNH